MILKKLQKAGLRKILEDIYLESDFIGSIDEICDKVNSDDPPVIYPIGAYKSGEITGFFTIELSNPGLSYKRFDRSSCWIGSFFVSENFLGKGFAKEILKELPVFIKKEYDFINCINLTVNMKNIIAKQLYLRCGFTDTEEIYSGGPFGPQHIFTRNL